MPKAIKHIRAGLLNLEVIGTVPEPGTGPRRGSRSRPTCAAQQFYNDKCSWRELALILGANFGRSDYVVTPTYNDRNLPPGRQEADRCCQRFIRKLRAARKKRGQELRYVYVTEGLHGAEARSRREQAERDNDGMDCFEDDGPLEDCRLHHHVVLNGCGPGDLEEIRSLWQGGGYVRIEPVDVHYYRELAKYLTKEPREFGRAKPGEHAWRASRNLRKYETEYIDIPSDSVALSPPPGAVDYVQFSERNPYGFADCVGAWYLLFDAEAPPDYSYTRGRGREKKKEYS